MRQFTLCRGKVRYRMFLCLCAATICYYLLNFIRLSENLGDQRDQPMLQAPNLHHKRGFRKVDILSVGSNTRLDYLQTQRNTFARHVSVRHFFNATEDSDADPYCSQSLSKWNVTQISRFCRRTKKWNPDRQFLLSYLQTAYANEVWLRRKANSPGWMCAQTRPMQGLYQTLQFYKTTKEDLPDFLIIIDDDTYYNVPLFHEYFQRHYPNSSKPVAVAGCRIRSPVDKINFTIPYGGYGVTFSKGYLSNLLRSINCPEDHAMCRAIRRTNHLDERKLFENGMSIADLMYTYATHQPFVNFSGWTTGFCLHSDWLWGFISNFYNASDHTMRNDVYSSMPHSRLEAYQGSELNAGDLDDHDAHGICEFGRGNCDAKAEACHYINPEQMSRVTEIVRRSSPMEFRTY